MVGGGELSDAVASEIANRQLTKQVHCYGSLGHEQALDVLAKLDVLVMTPRWEGLPLLPLEAMLMGVPVVSTAVGGIPEVIEHMQHGMLVENRSAQELADCVSLILDDESFRNKIVANAKTRAATEFGEQKMLVELAKTYQKAAGTLSQTT